MKTLLVIALAALMAPLPATAELPFLDEKEWLETFAGFENRDLRFQFFSKGTVLVHPLFKDKRIYPYVRIPIEISLAEDLADGSTKLHAILPETLESPDKATRKLTKTTVRGQFEGEARFELSLEQKRGEILLGGTLVDPGSFDAKSVRLRITAEVLNFYGVTKKELANDPKAFDALASESTLTLTSADRKRTKLDFTESLPAALDGSGKGSVRAAMVEIATIAPKTFGFEAKGASALRLAPRREGPLHPGFFIAWSPEESTRIDRDALFSIRVK